MKKFLICMFLTGAFGCDNATKTDANTVTELPKVEDYDQTCQMDSDCAFVNPDQCVCGALNVGINKSDAEVFQSLVDKYECVEPPTDCHWDDVVATGVSCDAGMCKTYLIQPPKIEDFDQTCQVNSDCDLVDGDDPCGCGFLVGINVSDVDAYREQFDRVMCDTVAGDCELPEPFAPTCVQGKCEARYLQEVKASNFSTSCETVEDCMLIAEGEVCQPCACPNIAVNAADYALQISPAECGIGDNVACNNCPQPDLGCVDNVCVAVEPM